MDDSPSNIVMLCHLCHAAMPSFKDRDKALLWVKTRDFRDDHWQLFTDCRWFGKGKKPNRQTTLFKARAEWSEIQEHHKLWTAAYERGEQWAIDEYRESEEWWEARKAQRQAEEEAEKASA